MLCRRGANALTARAAVATVSTTTPSAPLTSGTPQQVASVPTTTSTSSRGMALGRTTTLLGGGATKKASGPKQSGGRDEAVAASTPPSAPRVSTEGMDSDVVCAIETLRTITDQYVASAVEVTPISSNSGANAILATAISADSSRGASHVERITISKAGARSQITSRVVEYSLHKPIAPDIFQTQMAKLLKTPASTPPASTLVTLLVTIARRAGTTEAAAVRLTEANKVIGAVKKPAALALAEALRVESVEQREECEELLRRGYLLLNQYVRSATDVALTGAKKLQSGGAKGVQSASYIEETCTRLVGIIDTLGRLVGEKRTGISDQQRSRVLQSFTGPYAELCNCLSPLGGNVVSHAAASELFYGTVASASTIQQLTASFEPVDRSLYLLSLSALLNGSGVKNPITTVDQIPPILESLIRNGIAASYLARSPFVATMSAEKVRAYITATTALCSSMAGIRLVPKDSFKTTVDGEEGDEEEGPTEAPAIGGAGGPTAQGTSLNLFQSHTAADDVNSIAAASAAKSVTSEVLFPPFAGEILIMIRKLYSVKTTVGKQSSDVRNLTPLSRDQRLELTANMMLHGHMAEAGLLTATHVAVMRYQLRERQNTSKELPMAHYFTETVRSLILLEEKVCAAIAVAKSSVATSGDNTPADKARRMAAEVEVRRTREMCRTGLSNAMGTYTAFLTELTTKLLFLSKDQSTKAEAHEQMRIVYDALRPFATRLVAVAMIADSSRSQNSTIPTFGTLVASLQTTCPTLVAEAQNGGLAEVGRTTPHLDSSMLGWAAQSISQLNTDVLNSVGTVASQEVTEGFTGPTKKASPTTPLEQELLMYHTPTVNVKGSTRALVREFSTGGILRPLLFYILEQSSALPDAGMKSTDAIAKALSRMGSGGVASLDYRDSEEGAPSGTVGHQSAEVVVEVAINLTTSVTMQALNTYNFAAHFAASPQWEDAVSKWLVRFDADTISHLVREFARLERYVPADSERALQCHWRHILVKSMLHKWASISSKKGAATMSAEDLVAKALTLHDVTYLLMGDASGSAPIRPSAEVPNAVVACAEQLKSILLMARALPKAASEHAFAILHILSTTLVNLAKVPSPPAFQDENGAALHACLVTLLPSETSSCTTPTLATFRTHRDVLSFLSHLRDSTSGAASGAWLAEPTAKVVGTFTGAVGSSGGAAKTTVGAGLTPSEVIHLLDASTTGYLVPTLGSGHQGENIMPLETRRMCLQLITQRLLPAQPIESYSVAEALAIVRALCAVYNSTRLSALGNSGGDAESAAALLSTAGACTKIIKLIQLVVTKGLTERPVPVEMLLDTRSANHVPLKSWEVSAALATIALYFPADVIEVPSEAISAATSATLMSVTEVRELRQQILRRFVPYVLHAKLHLSPQDVMLSLYSLIAGGVYHATCIGGLLQRVNDLKGQFDISSALALVECGTLAERMAEGNRTVINAQSALDPVKIDGSAVRSIQGSGAIKKTQAMSNNRKVGNSGPTAIAGSGIEFNADSHSSISLSTSAAQSIQRACYANASAMLRLCVQSLLETNPDLLLSATARGSNAGGISADAASSGMFRISPYFRSVLLSRSRLTADDAAHRGDVIAGGAPVHSAESLAQKIFTPVDDGVASAATIATGAALQFHERRQRGSAISSGQVHALFQRQRVQTDVSGLRIVHAILKACPVDLVADTTLDVIASRVNEVTSVELLKEVLRLLKAKGSSDPRTLEILTSFTAKVISAPSWHHVAQDSQGKNVSGPQLVCVSIGDALDLAHLLLQIGARRDEIVTILSRRLRAKTGAILGSATPASLRGKNNKGSATAATEGIQERELHRLDVPGTVSLINLFRETQRDELGDLIRAVLTERLPETLPALATTSNSTPSILSFELPQPYSRTTAQSLATLSGSIHTFVQNPEAKTAVLMQLLAFTCGKSGPHRQSFVPLLSYNEIRTMMLAVDDSGALQSGDATAKLFIHQCIREILRRFYGDQFDRQRDPDGVEATDGRYCARVFEGFTAPVKLSTAPLSAAKATAAYRDAKNNLKVRLRPGDFLKKQRLDHAVEASGSLPDIGMATMLLCQLLKLRLGAAVVSSSTLATSATRAASDLLRSMPAPPPDTEIIAPESLALTAATLAAAAGDAAASTNLRGGASTTGSTSGMGGAFLVPAENTFGPSIQTLDAAIERDAATCVRVLLSHVYRYRQAMLSRLTLLEKLRGAVRSTVQYSGEVMQSSDKRVVFHKKKSATAAAAPTTLSKNSTAIMVVSEQRTSALATVLPSDKQSYVEVLHPQLFEVVLMSTATL